MKEIDFEIKVYCDDDIYELIDENDIFNDFIGKCISHFIHFVVPRRDQTNEIEEMYPIPKEIKGTITDRVKIERAAGKNMIYIRYAYW